MRVTMGTQVCFFVLFLEVGSRKSEVGSRKSEGGRWTLEFEVGSRKSLLGFRSMIFFCCFLSCCFCWCCFVVVVVVFPRKNTSEQHQERPL